MLGPLSFCISAKEILESNRADAWYHQEGFRDLVSALQRSSSAARLSDLGVTYIKGRTPTAAELGDEDVPLLKVGSITRDGDIDWDNVTYVPKSMWESKFCASSLSVNDIVVSSCGVSAGKVTVLAEEVTCGITGELLALRCNGDIDPTYLGLFLRSKYGKAQFDQNVLRGGGPSHIYDYQLDTFVVTQPDGWQGPTALFREALAEKSKARETRARLQTVIEQVLGPLRDVHDISFSYTAAELLDANRLDAQHSSPVNKEVNRRLNGVDCYTLQELCGRRITRGARVELGAHECKEIPMIKTRHLRNGFLDTNALHYVARSTFDSNAGAQAHKGDVLIAMTGVGSLGKVDLCTYEEALVDGEIAVIKVDQRVMDSRAVVAFLWTPYGSHQLQRMARGATRQTHLYPQEVATVKVPKLSAPVQFEVGSLFTEYLGHVERSRELRLCAVQAVERLVEADV